MVLPRTAALRLPCLVALRRWKCSTCAGRVGKNRRNSIFQPRPKRPQQRPQRAMPLRVQFQAEGASRSMLKRRRAARGASQAV